MERGLVGTAKLDINSSAPTNTTLLLLNLGHCRLHQVSYLPFKFRLPLKQNPYLVIFGAIEDHAIPQKI